MNRKHSMSDEEAQELIAVIRQRTRGLPGTSDYDYFWHSATTCELVEATLIGLGYDGDWVCGAFSRMLEAAVEQHRKAVFKSREGPSMALGM